MKPGPLVSFMCDFESLEYVANDLICTDEYFASLLTISWFKLNYSEWYNVQSPSNWLCCLHCKIKQKRSILIQQLQLSGALMCSVIRGVELH